MIFTTMLKTMASAALAVHLLAPVTAFAEVVAGESAAFKLFDVEAFLASLCTKAVDRKDEACISQHAAM